MESKSRNDVMNVGDNSEKMDIDCMENAIISNEPNPIRNPLLHYLVVKRLFEHFHLQEIKNRRFVCQEWNSVAQELLRKRSKIIFSNTKKDIPKFWNTFYASHIKHPFTHFVFKQEFFIHEALSIFRIYGPFIKILNFDQLNVKLQNPDGTITPYQRVDISNWISKCINLTELEINCSSGTRQCIPIRHLLSVKKLRLIKCDMLLEKDVKISPVEILLSQVNFFVHGKEKLPEIIFNNIFDFQKTELVLINQLNATPSILDVGQGVAKISEMILIAVKIINYEKSQWSIDNLQAARVSLQAKISIKIKKIRINNTSTFRFPTSDTYIIDFSMLPATLEDLHFLTGYTTNYISRTPVDLPNLKHLTIDICAGGDIPLSHFTNCQNLNSVLIIINRVEQQLILDVSFLPRDIKKLDINNGITIIHRPINVGEKFRINMLVLRARCPSTLRTYVDILQNIQPDILILVAGRRECSSDEIEQFVHQNVQLKTIFVNLVETDQSMDAPRNYFNPTDNRPKFSVFENQVCRPITRKEIGEVLPHILNINKYSVCPSTLLG